MVSTVLEARGEAGAAMSMTRSFGDHSERSRDELEARLRILETQVTTLTAAVDAASRLRISTPLRINHDIRNAGGKKVRRILEKGGLVRGYPEIPGVD